MWMFLVPLALWFLGPKIFQKIAPYLPTIEPQQAVFMGHLVVLQGAAVYVLPIEFFGLGAVKRMGYLACMWGSVGTCLWVLKSNIPAPPIPQGLSFSMLRSGLSQHLAPMRPWMMQVQQSIAFHFLFFGLIFLTAYPSLIPVGILARRSLWDVASQCNKADSERFVWRKFKPWWDKLQAKNEAVLVYSALAEVMLAFWLTANLILPSRQIITTIMYWQFLVIRYQVDRSKKYHAQAWQSLDTSTAPLFKAVPILRKPVDMAKGFFQPQYSYGR